ncbi:MAG: DUF308 domain-containing protein, partial [Chloroflexi bacterium]|nr:DUF308 domain-containing protein [Chloroflexota bacterium]
ITVSVFLYTFATFAFFCGVMALFSGLVAIGSRSNYWGWLVAVGLIGIIAGLLTLYWPGVNALLLVYIFAAWAIATGIGEIGGAVRFGTFLPNKWVLVAAGIISVLVGTYLFLFPGSGVLDLLLVIGVFTIIYGILQFVHMFLPSPRTTAP